MDHHTLDKLITLTEKVVISLLDLEEQTGGVEFPLEDVTFACWLLFPSTFGLAGRCHPDSLKTFKLLHKGRDGPIRSGQVRQAGRDLYALTASGRKAAYEIVHDFGVVVGKRRPALPPANQPSPHAEAALRRMLDCTAMDKVKTGMREEVSFTDACGFWGVPKDARREEVDHYQKAFSVCLEEASHLADNFSHLLLSDGREVDRSDIAYLKEVAHWLDAKFGKLLTILKMKAPPASLAV
jgi:hypothetical protein